MALDGRLELPAALGGLEPWACGELDTHKTAGVSQECRGRLDAVCVLVDCCTRTPRVDIYVTFAKFNTQNAHSNLAIQKLRFSSGHATTEMPSIDIPNGVFVFDKSNPISVSGSIKRTSH